MFIIIGMVVVLACVAVGYAMHHGDFLILIQINEYIIIGGAALGSMLIANPPSVIKAVIAGILRALKGEYVVPKEVYLEYLAMMYDVFQVAKRDGMIALEKHIETPAQSSIFTKYGKFLANHHAVDFFCDNLKVVLNGGIAAHDLEELMDSDIETIHTSELRAPTALNSVGDALPGLGIVAAVLGIIITMGVIDQPPTVIGHSVAAALVGTFFGILLSYGFVGPLAKAVENVVGSDGIFLNVLKAGLVAFVKGSAPIVAIEYGRRMIPPETRPSYSEAEAAVKSK